MGAVGGGVGRPSLRTSKTVQTNLSDLTFAINYHRFMFLLRSNYIGTLLCVSLVRTVASYPTVFELSRSHTIPSDSAGRLTRNRRGVETCKAGGVPIAPHLPSHFVLPR